MYYKENLRGKQYSSLKVIDFNRNTKNWICQCNCGNIVEVQTYTLKSGRKKSCGCQQHIRKCSQYPKLQKIYWKLRSKKEANDWENWDDFLSWALQNNYNELLSYKKRKTKLPYSKSNLYFGIKYNGHFLPMEDINKHNIYYNKQTQKFNIHFKYNNVKVTRNNFNEIWKLCETHITLYYRFFNKESFFV